MVATLGDLIDSGGSISAYCSAPRCGRTLDVDVYDLAWLFGRRAEFVKRTFPLKCATCGGNRISWSVSSDSRPADVAMREGDPQNFRSTRSDAERMALKLLYPRRF